MGLAGGMLMAGTPLNIEVISNTLAKLDQERLLPSVSKQKKNGYCTREHCPCVSSTGSLWPSPCPQIRLLLGRSEPGLLGMQPSRARCPSLAVAPVNAFHDDSYSLGLQQKHIPAETHPEHLSCSTYVVRRGSTQVSQCMVLLVEGPMLP